MWRFASWCAPRGVAAIAEKVIIGSGSPRPSGVDVIGKVWTSPSIGPSFAMVRRTGSAVASCM